MKKIIIIAVAVLLLVGCYMGIYTNKKVEVSIDAITYKLSDENYERKSTIRVDGRLAENKFNQKKFVGDIYINDIELKNLELSLDKNNTASFDNCEDLDLRGRFYIDNDFRNVLLYLYGGQLGDTEIVNHMIISGPADNRKEAFQLTKELSRGK